MRRQLIIAGFTVLGCGILLGAVLIAGKIARNAVSGDRRYQILFSQIECLPPPGMEREQFLAEVRYYGEFADTISLLDDSLAPRLTAAFEAHPWVKHVESVDVNSARGVRVGLAFRIPVLAVVYDQAQIRAVDRDGVVLPKGADTLALPHLGGMTAPAAPGRPWGNRKVEGAARLAALLRPHQAALNLMEFRWLDGQLRLRRASAALAPEVIWGQPPGADSVGEPSAEVKLQRLLDYANRLGDSTGRTIIDLRQE